MRSVLESELAMQACDEFTSKQIDLLWENIALWKMYIERNDEEKIFQLDKDFHKLLYILCGKNYWYGLVDRISPHYDRTTILSFRCKELGRILADHEGLIKAIEKRDKEEVVMLVKRHMKRYDENIIAIRDNFSEYFKQPLF